MFQEGNLSEWIFIVEQYFTINGIRDADKVLMAAICMDGPTLTWLQWEETRRPITDWREFKHYLTKKFRPTQEG